MEVAPVFGDQHSEQSCHGRDVDDVEGGTSC